MAGEPGLISAKRGGAMWSSRAPRISSVMPVEAMVMTEMAMMMPVMMVVAEMVAVHPGSGVEHARIDVDDADAGGMRGSARAVGHRGHRRKHGNRKQRGGNCFQHGCVLQGIVEMAVGWPVLVDHALNLRARAEPNLKRAGGLRSSR